MADDAEKHETCYWCDQPAARFCISPNKPPERTFSYEPFYDGRPFAWCAKHDHNHMKTITYEEYVVFKVLTS